MPTYTAIAFENLLEPRVRKSYGKQQLNERNEEEKVVEDIEPPPASSNHIFISPALYITPEPAPIPETSSGSLSPSPYVVNHKRRGGGEAFAKRKLDGLEEVKQVNEKTDLDLKLEEELADENLFEEDEGFLDPRCDASSIGSVNEVKGLDCRSYVSAQGEFFDADEDFSVEGSSLNGSTCGPNIELELRATRLKLLEEIERRKTSEDALNMMRCQWQNISTVLSQAGLTLPSPSDVIGDMQLDNSSIEQLYQEVVVSRYVTEAIGKGQARAEAELAAESILESKNQEISRLRDRLRYYEAVNHEMSQRNQEIIEVARKQRQRKRTQKKWLWSCIGLSAVIGVSVVAYKYVPQELRRIKPVPKLACHSVASWCHPRAPNLDILTCVKDSHIWAVEHPTYSALTRPLCELSALVPPQLLVSHKKLKVYSMVAHPLQPHLVATGTNIGIILCEFDQKSLPPVAVLPTPTESREHTAVYVVERELKLLQFQLSNTTAPALGSNGSLSDTGRLRGEIPEQLHVKQTKKHITTPAPHDSYSVLSVSSSGKYLAIVWPDIPYFSIYKVSDWTVVDSGSARLLAWDTCRDRFALLESALAPRIPIIPKGSSRKAKEAAAAAAQAAAAAASAASSATVQVRILLDDGTSNVLMKSVGSRSEPVIGLHGGALLGVAYRTSRRVSAAAATAISTIQSMPLSGYGGSSVSSFSTMDDGSQKSAAEAAPQNFQLYSWETFQPVGGLLPQPDWTAWDQTVEYCAFGYPQHIVICSLRPQFRYLGDVAIPFATGAVWQRRQLFVATPTTVECVFVDAGVAAIDIETKRRKEEMKLKEAQSRAIAEHGELALITVDNQQSNPQERIALRPPMLQVVRLASFQHAPSIPPFLSLPRQSKVDGDASSVLREMEARKANEVAVGGGGVAVAVTRFPAEQTRPVGPLVIVGVRDGVLWLIDRYMCAHAISLSHPGIRCRCLAAYGDAVSAVKWASRLGREHHDDLAQFMLGMGYATEALHLPGISKRLEFDLALQSNDLKRALQCLLTMSNSRDIGQETVGLDLNDLMNMTKKKENVVEAVQGVVKFAKEFMELIDAADATAQADIAREALKRLAAAGSIKGALRGQELRGVALRLANHGELTRLSNLVNNLISVGAGREAAFAAALLGDNVLMEKAWQETGMLAEAVLHAHAHGRPSMRTLVQSWNKMLQKEMEHTPSMKTDAAAAFLASLEGPKLTSLADAAKKPPIEILPPGMASLYGPNPGQAKPLLGKQGLPQPGKPLLLEGSKTTAPIASVPAGSNIAATSESGVPPKSENGASTTPESSNPPASDSGAAPASETGAAPPASETGTAPPATETGAAPPATESGAAPPATESGAAPATESGAAPTTEAGAAPATETGAAPAVSSTTQASNSDTSVAAEAIVPATLALDEKPSDYLALVSSTSAAVEPTTIGAIVPSTSATGPPPAADNKKPSVPDERLMIDFS